MCSHDTSTIASVNFNNMVQRRVVRSSQVSSAIHDNFKQNEPVFHEMVAEQQPNSGSKRTILASVAALGSVIVASSCCLPLLPFLFAAGAAGSSAYFVRLRPYLLVISVLLIGFGFYQRWRAKKCNRRPGVYSAILLWFSAIVVFVFIVFPQVIANMLANFMAG